jgi:hypothetical protein
MPVLPGIDGISWRFLPNMRHFTVDGLDVPVSSTMTLEWTRERSIISALHDGAGNAYNNRTGTD